MVCAPDSPDQCQPNQQGSQWAELDGPRGPCRGLLLSPVLLWSWPLLLSSLIHQQTPQGHPRRASSPPETPQTPPKSPAHPGPSYPAVSGPLLPFSAVRSQGYNSGEKKEQ
ncbi:unnamed protein product [Arctogadus glacialis]